MKRVLFGIIFSLISIFAFAQNIGPGDWYYAVCADKFTDEKYLTIFKLAEEETYATEYSMYIVYKQTSERMWLALNAPFEYVEIATIRFDKYQPTQIKIVRDGSFLHFLQVGDMVKMMAASNILLVKLGNTTYTFDLAGFKDTFNIVYGIFSK